MNLCVSGFDCVSTAAGYSCINATQQSAVAIATPASSALAADTSSPVVLVVVIVVLLLVLAAIAAWYFCWHKRKQPSTDGAVQVPLERTGDWEQVLQHDTDTDEVDMGTPREAYAQFGNNAQYAQVEGRSPDGVGGQYFLREEGSPVAPPTLPLRLPPRPMAGLADVRSPASAGRPEGAPRPRGAVEQICPEGVTIHMGGMEGN